MPPVEHPAKYTPAILEAVLSLLPPPPASILDPFAGVGGIHRLAEHGYSTAGIELEAEWARQHYRTHTGDARGLPFAADTFDAVVTSPCYGNRMADTYDGRSDRGGRFRYTYRTSLGRRPSAGSAAAMQWGAQYRELHIDAWLECARVLRPHGVLILNCKDHIRKGERQHVTDWHVSTLESIGFAAVEHVEVSARGIAHTGKSHGAKIDYESVIKLRLP